MSRSPTEARAGRRGWLGRLARRWQRPHTLFVDRDGVWAWAPAAGAVAVRHADVPAWCRSNRGQSARLVLSGRSSLQVVAREPGLAQAEPETLAAWARHQFSHYHGSEAERWPLATWSEGGCGGATALRGIDLAAVRADAAGQGVDLASAQPWWAVALRSVSRLQPAFAQQAQGGLVLVEHAAVTWLLCRRGTVVDIQQRWLDACNADALAGLLAELIDAAADDPSSDTGHALPCWVLGYGCAGFEEAAAVRAGARIVVLSTLGAAGPLREWVEG